MVRQEFDLTPEEIQRRLLDEHQQTPGLGSILRFFDRHGISSKKFGRLSKIGLMSARRERRGRTTNPSSIPRVFLNQNPRGERLVGKNRIHPA